MSPEVEQALTEQDLWEDYHARPAYQQNDYMWWINSAKRPETREKRLAQMLEELRKGGDLHEHGSPDECKRRRMTFFILRSI